MRICCYGPCITVLVLVTISVTCPVSRSTTTIACPVVPFVVPFESMMIAAGCLLSYVAISVNHFFDYGPNRRDIVAAVKQVRKVRVFLRNVSHVSSKVRTDFNPSETSSKSSAETAESARVRRSPFRRKLEC